MTVDLNKKIRRIMSQYVEINEQEWEFFSSVMQYKTAKRREILVNNGDTAENIYFVISGMLRLYRVDSDGHERTLHFSVANTFAVDYEQFLTKSPSKYVIQATEDTTVAYMSLDMLHNLYKTISQGEKLGRVITEKYFFLLSNRIQAIYTQTPLERFNDMKIQFPQIMQKVPQRCIASYLNITPTHLSRLKKADLLK